MKIRISPKLFSGELSRFKGPMEQAGICVVDETLELGQMVITDGAGQEFLIEMASSGNITVRRLDGAGMYERH